MSKHPPPAPTASAVSPCPTMVQISRTPRHWKFTQHHRTTRPPPKRRKNAMRKDERTPCEKTKPATRKDELLAQKDEKTPCEKTPFERVGRKTLLFCRPFAWRLFVLSHGVFFVFSPGVILCFRMASFRGAITPGKKNSCEKMK